MNILGHARFWIIDVLRGTNIVATLKKLRKEQYLDYKTLSNLSHSSYKNIIEKVIHQISIVFPLHLLLKKITVYGK